MIVVDTNVISYLLIEGDFTENAQKTLLKDPKWVAPYLWRSEFRNVLALYVRHNKMSIEHAITLMEEAESIMLSREYQVSSNRVLNLVSQSNCSVYDCEFVALASLLDVQLITSDKKVIREFPTQVTSLNNFATT